MTQLSGQPQVIGGPLFTSGGDSSPGLHTVGTRVESNDGRTFRYVFCTPTALVVGQLQQGPAEVTNHQNLTPVAAAIGATTASFSLGATLAQLNQYAGGYLVVSTGTGVGYAYQIKGHLAAASSGSLTVNLLDPVEVATSTDTRVDLVQNPYYGVIVSPATPTGAVVGVATDVISAGNYGWIQSGGPAVVLADGALLVGRAVSKSASVAGRARQVLSTADALIGYAVTGVASDEYGVVNLTID